MFLGILRCGVVHSLWDFKKLTPMRPAEADYLGDFKTGCFCRDSSWVWHTLPKPTPTCLPISPFLWRCFAEVVFSLIFNHCLGTQRHLVPLTHPAVAAAAAHKPTSIQGNDPIWGVSERPEEHRVLLVRLPFSPGNWGESVVPHGESLILARAKCRM